MMNPQKENGRESGDSILSQNAAWNFGGAVPEYFEEHAKKSIPFYEEGHDLIAKISDYFISDDSLVYDLGCSTGKLLASIAERHKHRPQVRYIGIDSEKAMAEHATAHLKDDSPIQIEHENILSYPYQACDLVIAYYTVQFVRPAVRQELLNKIYECLRWGGALLMFEKVRGPDARFQDMLTGLYQDYKLDQGYSPSEIVNKSRSLKGVLEPFSSAGNDALLTRAGFADRMVVMRYVCFEGVLAIK